LQEKIKTLEAGGGGAMGDDDDFLTLGKAKTLLKTAEQNTQKAVEGIRGDFARERELVDERRMKGLKDLPIPYADAIKVFVSLAKVNPAFYRQVQDEASQAGGRPAELAYKIAIREHPEFVQKIKELGANDLITNLNKAGKGPKGLPGSGGHSGPKDVNDMSIEELINMDDATWEKHAKGET